MSLILPPALREVPKTETQFPNGGTTGAVGKAPEEGSHTSTFSGIFAQINQQQPPSREESPSSVPTARGNALQENSVEGGEGSTVPLDESLGSLQAPRNIVSDLQLNPQETAVLVGEAEVKPLSGPTIEGAKVEKYVSPQDLSQGEGIIQDDASLTKNTTRSSSLAGNPSGSIVPPLSEKHVRIPELSINGTSVGQQQSAQGKTGPSIVADPEPPILPLARDPGVAFSQESRPATVAVPTSFSSHARATLQSSIEATGGTSPVPSSVPGVPLSSAGHSSVAPHDGLIQTALGGTASGEHKEGGLFLGSEQHQNPDEGQTFFHKSSQSNQTPGSPSLMNDLVRDVRANDSQIGARSENVGIRTGSSSFITPHRLQMEVMLSEETKVHLDVAVKQQQVSAQLLTDQWFLRNLALQQEPHLDAQLSSVGLELKQFGAEVNEQGGFGQHLGHDSSPTSPHRGKELSPSSDLVDIPSPIGIEVDGRLHFVA